MIPISRFFERCPRTPLLLFVLFILIRAVPYAFSQQAKADDPKVSKDALTEEQLSIYRLILGRWMSGEVASLNLDELTEVFPTDGAICFKGLDMEPEGPSVIHRFRAEDLPQLGNTKIRIVRGDMQENEVKKHDPGDQIRRGRSIDDALKEGFANARTWFSEVRFDKSRTHAVVYYGFHCGSLCGNGGTAILEKRKEGWVFKSQCSIWMS